MKFNYKITLVIALFLFIIAGASFIFRIPVLNRMWWIESLALMFLFISLNPKLSIKIGLIALGLAVVIDPIIFITTAKVSMAKLWTVYGLFNVLIMGLGFVGIVIRLVLDKLGFEDKTKLHEKTKLKEMFGLMWA